MFAMYTPRQNARILLSAGKIRQQNVFYKEIITMRILVTDGMDKTAMAELRAHLAELEAK